MPRHVPACRPAASVSAAARPGSIRPPAPAAGRSSAARPTGCSIRVAPRPACCGPASACASCRSPWPSTRIWPQPRRTRMARPASIEVIAPGLLTTVQGAPRHGLRHLGVASGGPADPWAHALANLLAGNPVGHAGLEITLAGPTLHFAQAARVAICGAAIEARADGVPVPGNRPVELPRGVTLTFGTCLDGARSYLAVAGGLEVAPVLGSTSTDLRGGFGGLDGRALQAGDRLAVGDRPAEPARQLLIAPWWIDANPLPYGHPPGEPCTIRLLPGTDSAEGVHGPVWRV